MTLPNLPDPQTPIPLSTAIRLGSMIVPQTDSEYVRYKEDEDGCLLIPIAACALGAAGIAVGMEVVSDDVLLARWPILNMPSRVFGNPQVFTAIIHMNDRDHKTREEIADWVAEIEARYPAVACVPIPDSLEGESDAPHDQHESESSPVQPGQPAPACVHADAAECAAPA